MESRLEPVRRGFARDLQVFRAAFKDNTLPAKPGARAPARALTWRGGSPRQAEDSPACNRRLLRRGDTGWGAAGGELPVRNLDSVYSRNTVNSIRPDGGTSLRVLSEVRPAAQASPEGRSPAQGGAGQRGGVSVLKESVNRRKAATSPEGGWRQNGRKCK